jgi:4-amino-4-deoxy-L-arabinose transferase-like glycosyltransferase
MSKLVSYCKQNKLSLILVLGLMLRLFYVFFFSSFFAKAYLGRETIFYSGSDFGTSLSAFNNLIRNGAYSINLDEPLCYFNRMPGYSFFIGIISLLFSNPYNMYMVSFLQIIFDVASIYLLYKICVRLTKSDTVGLIAAFLYATHPIIILWCPVLMSDSLGAFCSLLVLYYYSKSESKFKWFLVVWQLV